MSDPFDDEYIKCKLGILVEIEDDTNFIESTWEFDIILFPNFYKDIQIPVL